MNWYLKVLKQYADFKGRARRKEYWMFTLFNVLISSLLSLPGIIGAAIEVPMLDQIGSGLIILYSLAVFIPGLAVGVRRLHDIGKSGWMLLVGLIPLVGFIWLLVLLTTDSQPGTNEYGPNPKV